MGSPPKQIDFFHHFFTIFPLLTPANFLPNTPRQFIFTSHIARVESLSEKFHTTLPDHPLPMGSPPKKIDFFHHFFTIFPPLTPANFLPNTPRQFIFTSHIARVEVCQKNFTQPSPTTPYPWVAPLKKLTFFTIFSPFFHL